MVSAAARAAWPAMSMARSLAFSADPAVEDEGEQEDHRDREDDGEHRDGSALAAAAAPGSAAARVSMGTRPGT